MQGVDAVRADLVAGLDRDDAEPAHAVGVLQSPVAHEVLHQHAVPGLEDVQGQDETGEQDAAEGEQREALRHAGHPMSLSS